MSVKAILPTAIRIPVQNLTIFSSAGCRIIDNQEG
jgi:hypothetical protein